MGCYCRKIPLGEKGFSVVEILVAGALLGFIAIALLPAMFSTMDQLKVTDFKSQCAAMVRAKLNEYVNGMTTDTDGSSPLGFIPTGYEYTKRRYQWAETPGKCPQGDGKCCQEAGVDPGSPGFRERVVNNEIIRDDAGQDNSSFLNAQFLGFQLYVMIRHYNPRVNAGAQPIRSCPASTYQFFRVGDAFEVTVTGMIRVQPDKNNSGRGRQKWGNLDDLDDSTPNPLLTCSATQVIYPPSIPFRYYIGVDGKMRSMMARLGTPVTDASSTNQQLEAMESHYRSLWSTVVNNGDLNSPAIGNVKAIVAAPDNKSAYVLKPGVITLYKECNDNNQIKVGATTFQGVPDCNRDASKRESWPSAGNIESIAVDFQELDNFDDDVIYGLYNSGAVGGALMKFKKNGASSTWEAATGMTKVPDLPRIRGIFLNQTFPALTTGAPNLFFIDNTCYDGGKDDNTLSKKWVYCVTILNAADPDTSLTVSDLPVQVQSVSF